MQTKARNKYPSSKPAAVVSTWDGVRGEQGKVKPWGASCSLIFAKRKKGDRSTNLPEILAPMLLMIRDKHCTARPYDSIGRAVLSFNLPLSLKNISVNLWSSIRFPIQLHAHRYIYLHTSICSSAHE